MRSEKQGPNRSERSERSEMDERERSEKSESPLRTRTSDHESGPDRESDRLNKVDPSTPGQLAKERFDGTWVYWLAADGTVRKAPPDWLDWPHNTLADLVPVRPPVAELAAQSKAKRK